MKIRMTACLMIVFCAPSAVLAQQTEVCNAQATFAQQVMFERHNGTPDEALVQVGTEMLSEAKDANEREVRRDILGIVRRVINEVPKENTASAQRAQEELVYKWIEAECFSGATRVRP